MKIFSGKVFRATIVIAMSSKKSRECSQKKVRSETRNLKLLKNTSNAPLNVQTWDCIKQSKRNKIWELVKEIFEVKEEDKEVFMDQCRDRYRSRKYKLKVKDFDNKMTQSHPKLIPEEQWKWLVFYWSSEDFKNISSRNINNRSRVDMAHTSGSKSFIRIKS
ncbi:hypothetical protein F8388_016383 [Cannabis sativa]|uniref:Uncharacterized protein n=1 Tax=Cannabis sativa TaxID=3483 RepID=A0A7J6GTM2_CANSA|nr:hypothetical protein F8388_016383 [Cannabis sativa]